MALKQGWMLKINKKNWNFSSNNSEVRLIFLEFVYNMAKGTKNTTILPN